MKAKYAICLFILIGVVFFVEYDLSQRIIETPNVPRKMASVPIASPVVEAAKEPEVATPSIFESQFVAEAQKISQLQNDPKAVDEKIDHLAQSMTSFEIKKLSVMIESKTADGDQRAMAVELLSRSKSVEAMDVLKDFVVSHETGPTQSWNRNREFESVLRAQAIEGIAAYPQKDLALTYLNSLADKVDESFLKDRIVRSEESLKGHAPTTQQQDETALKQLVQ